VRFAVSIDILSAQKEAKSLPLDTFPRLIILKMLLRPELTALPRPPPPPGWILGVGGRRGRKGREGGRKGEKRKGEERKGKKREGVKEGKW